MRIMCALIGHVHDEDATAPRTAIQGVDILANLH